MTKQAPFCEVFDGLDNEPLIYATVTGPEKWRINIDPRKAWGVMVQLDGCTFTSRHTLLAAVHLIRGLHGDMLASA